MRKCVMFLAVLSLTVLGPTFAWSASNRMILKNKAYWQFKGSNVWVGIPLGVIAYDAAGQGLIEDAKVRILVNGVPADSAVIGMESARQAGNCVCNTFGCGSFELASCNEDSQTGLCWCGIRKDWETELGPIPVGKAILVQMVAAPGSVPETYTADDTATVILAAPIVPGSGPVPGAAGIALLLLAGGTSILARYRSAKSST